MKHQIYKFILAVWTKFQPLNLQLQVFLYKFSSPYRHVASSYEGSGRKSNLEIIQRIQNKVLKSVANAP